MTGDQHLLHRLQVPVRVLLQTLELRSQLMQLAGDVDPFVGRMGDQRLDLLLQIDDVFFELEMWVGRHGSPSLPVPVERYRVGGKRTDPMPGGEEIGRASCRERV